MSNFDHGMSINDITCFVLFPFIYILSPLTKMAAKITLFHVFVSKQLKFKVKFELFLCVCWCSTNDKNRYFRLKKYTKRRVYFLSK